MFVRHAFDAERFTIEAVLIETLVKEAFVDCRRVLVMFERHAFDADRFTTEAVFTLTFTKEAFVDC